MEALKRLRFATSARTDLADIAAYIAIENPAAAEKIVRAIHATASTLAAFPAIGRPGRRFGTREFPVADLPYLIVYDVAEDILTILAVYHGARDITRALAARRDDLNRP